MEREIHKNTDEARAGTTPHVVRYVLTISLILIVLAFGALLLWGMGPTTSAG